MTTGYHESGLSDTAEDLHRGFASLIEEVEAADWYTQRIDVCRDETLKAALEHNRDEELEHAAMLIEWLRRMLPRFDEHLHQYLFTTGSISEEEGMLLSPRIDNFELTVGQDFSVGYASHDHNTVELYLVESFTFRVLEPRASVECRMT